MRNKLQDDRVSCRSTVLTGVDSTSVSVESMRNLSCFCFNRKKLQVLSKACMIMLCSKRNLQDDHLSGKPGNVGDFTNNKGNVMEKNLVREKLPKTVYCKLHISVHTVI